MDVLAFQKYIPTPILRLFLVAMPLVLTFYPQPLYGLPAKPMKTI